MRRALLIALVAALASTAFADKPASLDHYRKGKRAYSAGRFAAAVEEFERAFDEWPAPEYLHDTAQAFRRLDRCADAIDYFERYLVAKPAASNRAEVAKQVGRLRARCPGAIAATTSTVAEAAPKPSQPAVAEPTPGVPTAGQHELRGTAEVTSSGLPATASATMAAQPSFTTVTQAAEDRASRWSTSAAAGLAFLEAGPVAMPPVTQVTVAGQYRTRLPLSLELGAGLALARLPYDDVMSGTVWLGGPEVLASASTPLADRLTLVGTMALAAQLVWGLHAGNPFTSDQRASASFVMPRLRADLGVAWRSNQRLTLCASVGYQVSIRRAALASDIPALHGFAVSAGFTFDL